MLRVRAIHYSGQWLSILQLAGSKQYLRYFQGAYQHPQLKSLCTSLSFNGRRKGTYLGAQIAARYGGTCLGFRKGIQVFDRSDSVSLWLCHTLPHGRRCLPIVTLPTPLSLPGDRELMPCVLCRFLRSTARHTRIVIFGR